MGYRHWVFLHLAGVFGFLASHGVSMAVAIRLRKERDIARIGGLLDVSSRTVGVMYASLGALLAGGIGATFAGGLWGFGWIWAALVLVAVTVLAMIFMAKPYYQKVRFVTRAVAEGSKAVTGEQVDEMLRSNRPNVIMGIGFVGLALILVLMIFKPTLGIEPTQAPLTMPSGPTVQVAAENSNEFVQTRVSAPAGVEFSIVFENRESGVPHNVAIYTDDTAKTSVVVGELFPGPATRVMRVPALDAGTYFFRCDVHPRDMTGRLVVE
ncbi:MAG TPA: cupredoxin domain-containing protein [Actinomycetota bacterium]|nr:cupredoxin domain-containing protein [Actinomycetota bacterium]